MNAKPCDAAIAQWVQEILAAVDAPPVDSTARSALQRIYRRKELFGGDGRGHVTLVIRTIIESTGNLDALVEPIVSAVEMSMRPQWTERGLAWIEAFDSIPLMAILTTMRSLDLFSEQSLPAYFSNVLHNKLCKILGPAEPAAKPLPKRERKPPASLTRIPGVEASISLGKELLDLRSQFKTNIQFGRAVRAKFPDLDNQTASLHAMVARAYADKPQIFRRLSWHALVQLSSPTLPVDAWEALERRVLAGDKIGANDVRATREALKPGRPQRQADQRTRMAA